MSHFADSNRRPTHYECVALPTELKWPQLRFVDVCFLESADPTLGRKSFSLVGVRRLELPTSTSRTWRASQLRYTPQCVLAGIRTLDPLIKSQLLYQLSYQDSYSHSSVHSHLSLFQISLFVLRVGLEPTRPCGQGILSPSCLPFHHQSSLPCRLPAAASGRGWVTLSGKRDSNSRPRPWQGRALPTELFPQLNPLERKTRLELATPTLARSCSTN